MDNPQLKTAALKTVAGIRKLIGDYSKAGEANSIKRMQAMSQASTLPREEQNKIWNSFNQTDTTTFRDCLNSYVSDYKVDASLYRQEMLSRLPP
jgi:hypothetical protein